MRRGHDEITNSQDVIDSRDIIARIEYLEDERTTLADTLDSEQEEWDELTQEEKDEADSNEALVTARDALKEWDESEEGQELKALKELQDQAEGYSDWTHGATLIRDSYFQTYAEELASDIGAVDKDAAWPTNRIDWEAAADDLKVDYSTVDFDGVDYWVR